MGDHKRVVRVFLRRSERDHDDVPERYQNQQGKYQQNGEQNVVKRRHSFLVLRVFRAFGCEAIVLIPFHSFLNGINRLRPFLATLSASRRRIMLTSDLNKLTAVENEKSVDDWKVIR